MTAQEKSTRELQAELNAAQERIAALEAENKQLTEELTWLKKKGAAGKIGNISYETIVNVTAEGFWLLNPELKTAYVNQSLCQMLGYTAPEMMGRSPLDFVDDTNRPIFEKQLGSVSETNHRTYQIALQQRDGGKVPTIFNATTLVDSAGQVVGAFAFVTDITPLKKMERALRRSERKLDNILWAIMNGVVVVDLEGQITYANQSAERILRLRRDKILERYFSEREWQQIDEQGQPLPAEKLPLTIALTRQQEVRYLEHGIIDPEGRYIWLAVNAAPLFDDNEQLYGAVASFQDITERQQVERVIQEAKTALEKRVTELSTLNHIGQTVATVTDLSTALDEVAQQITYLFDVQGVSIGLFDETQSEITVVTEYAQDAADFAKTSLMGQIFLIADYVPAQKALKDRRTIIYTRPQGETLASEFRQILVARHVASLVMVPLLVRGDAIGLIGLFIEQPERQFSQNEIRLAETIAGQIAGAIENVRLFEEEQRQRRVAESLREVAVILNSSLHLDVIVARILKQLAHVISYEGGAVFLREAEQLVISDAVGKAGHAKIGRTVALNSKNPAARVFAHNKLLIINDGDREPHWPPWPEAGDFQSWMGAPLSTWGKVFGVLTVDSTEKNAFSREDATILETFAGQAALAIENAHRFEAERRALEQAETLYNAALALSATMDLDQVLETILTELQRVVPYDSASVQVLTDEGFEVVSGRGFDNLADLIGTTYDPSRNPLERIILEAGQPVIVEDVRDFDEFQPFWSDGVRAWLAVPLLFGDRVVGKLGIDKGNVGFFTQPHAEWAMAFAAQAAIALENARFLRETQRAREAAEAANYAKSEFLATMSHELRTPLNGILGYAQILGRDTTLSPKQKEAVNIIHTSGDHLLLLINDILDVAKIEAGKLELRPSEVNLPHFLDIIADIIEVRAREKGLLFIYETPPTLPTWVMVDEKRLRQVLLNLLSNAVKFTQRGQVSFKIAYHHQKIRFHIEDTGRGIPTDHREEIFTPFHQLRQKGDVTEGTGLGLTISQQIARMMDSEIKVESKEGQGSVFWFDLHLPPTAGQPDPYQTEAGHIAGYHHPREPLKILIIDDKLTNRLMLSHMLSSLGFEVAEAINGEDGLAKAIAFEPDLILIDLIMPILDGFEATRRIRQTPTIREAIIIAISASAAGPVRENSLAAGCDDYLPKPVNFDSLLAKIGLFLGVEWIYPEEPVPPLAADDQPFLIPPQDLLEQINALVLIGAIRDLQDFLKRMAHEQPELTPFATKINGMADAFQLNEIQALIQQYLGE